MTKSVALSQFPNDSTLVVPSITALKALLKTGTPEAFVAGYYAQGDGGGGSYWYDSTDTTSADNGGSIIVASDGGRWKLATTQPWSVRQFGAKGDGTTDDTAAILAAIAAMPATGGILDAIGVFKITALIDITKPITLRGAGLLGPGVTTPATQFLWYGAASGIMVRIGGNGATLSGGGLENLDLNGLGVAGKCLQVKDLEYGRFQSLSMQQATVAHLELTNTSSVGLVTGFHSFRDIYINGRALAPNTASGIWINGTNAVTLCTMDNIEITHTNGPGVRVTFGDAFFWGRLQTFRIDTDTGAGVHYDAVAGATVGGHIFINPLASAGFVFDTAGLAIGTKIINLDMTNINAGVTELVSGPGASDIDVTSTLGLFYGQQKTLGLRETIKHDSMTFGYMDLTNSMLHTMDGIWNLGGGAGTSITDAATPGGGVTLTTAASLSSMNQIYRGAVASGVHLNTLLPNFGAAVHLNSTANICVRVGLFNNNLDPPTSGVYFEYDTAISANWYVVSRLAGVETSTILSGFTDPIQFRIETASAGTVVNFYWRASGYNNWVLATSATTNVPVSNNLYPAFTVIARSSAAVSATLLDFKLGFRTEV